MDFFNQILQILIARYRLVLYVMAGTVIFTVIACLVLPPRYKATATVLVDSKPDPVASVLIQTGVVPNINIGIGTEVDIVSSERVARRVATMLKLDEDEKVKEDWRDATGGKGSLISWLGELLLRKLTVKQSSLQTNVIPIKFESVDPNFAAAAANAFAQAYVEYSVLRKVEPARQYLEWFTAQEKSLRESSIRSQAKLLQFQQEKGLVARDEQLDDENTKLVQLTQQLAAVQGQTADARSRETTTNAERLPDVASNPVLTSLKSEIATREGKLQDTAVNLGRNHPQFQRMEAEIASLKEKLQAETRNVTSGFSASLSLSRKKEAELRAAIEIQRNKLLKIKSFREEFTAMQRDVDLAKKTYDGVVAQLNQAKLDSQVNQSNVIILTPAVAPSEPSFPKLVLFTLLSFPLGLLLGVGSAYLFELVDRRVRIAGDIGESLQLPVLGVIAPPRPHWRARLAPLWRRRKASATAAA
jgi:chain length determinant protein EpsF